VRKNAELPIRVTPYTLSDAPGTMAAAARAQDRFSLDQRDIRPELGPARQPLFGTPSVSISGAAHPQLHTAM
jgi:hypothetical protein